MNRPKLTKKNREGHRERPDVFGYHDFRVFLRDWFRYLKESDRNFSVRKLAEKAQLSSAYFSMILSGKRGMSLRSFSGISPNLLLTAGEVRHLESLIELGTFNTQDSRLEVLGKISRHRTYRRKNPAEAEFYAYASHWYHMAIRELASLPGFRADESWIRSKLRTKVPARAISDALKFLFEAGYLKKEDSRVVASSDETVRVDGPIFWGALTQAHRQMFSLATESIDNTPADQRNLIGLTVSMNQEKVKLAAKILDRAIADIVALGDQVSGPDDRVCQVQLALFPLTKGSEG